MGKIRLITVLALFLSVGLVGCNSKRNENWSKFLTKCGNSDVNVTLTEAPWGETISAACIMRLGVDKTIDL